MRFFLFFFCLFLLHGKFKNIFFLSFYKCTENSVSIFIYFLKFKNVDCFFFYFMCCSDLVHEFLMRTQAIIIFVFLDLNCI